MAKKFPNIETLKVYQKGGDNQDVKKCPEATTDTEVNIDNRERSIARANYSRADSEDKCGNCIFFDISGRMKKCMETKSNNEGYCWDQEFVCSSENICDMWEEGGPIKSNNSSYLKDESYESEYEQNKQEVEEIQTTKQMPIAGQEQQQEMSPEVMQQMMAQQGPPQGPPQAMAPPLFIQSGIVTCVLISSFSILAISASLFAPNDGSISSFGLVLILCL